MRNKVQTLQLAHRLRTATWCSTTLEFLREKFFVRLMVQCALIMTYPAADGTMSCVRYMAQSTRLEYRVIVVKFEGPGGKDLVKLDICY